jgi:predicted N-acetyltransferase YhbS
MTALQIRAMIPDDFEAVSELLAAGGWHRGRGFMQLMFEIETCQPLVGTLDGRIVATGQGIANGPVGWIGSIFVDTELRGGGLGRAMTEEVCRRLNGAGCRTLALVASDLGRPIYEKMGFRHDAVYRTYAIGPLPDAPATPPGRTLRPMSPADIDLVCHLDSRATGEDRRSLLTHLAGRGRLLEDAASQPVGYLMPFLPGSGGLIAAKPADAAILLEQLRYVSSDSEEIRAVVVDGNSEGIRLLEERGWKHSFDVPRMVLGPAIDWLPNQIWGILGFAFG